MTRWSFLLIEVLLTAFVGVGCSRPEETQASRTPVAATTETNSQSTTTSQATVTGILGIENESGEFTPVADVAVNLAGGTLADEVTTTAAGTFSIKVPDELMRNGTSALTESMVSWHAIQPDKHVGVKQENVRIIYGINDLGRVELTPTGSITGQILAQNAPVEDATITLSGTIYQATTDADGRFKIENIPAASWTVEVKASGFTLERVDAEVVSGEVDDVGVVSLKR